jgi:hypothetical protein
VCTLYLVWICVSSVLYEFNSQAWEGWVPNSFVVYTFVLHDVFRETAISSRLYISLNKSFGGDGNASNLCKVFNHNQFL